MCHKIGHFPSQNSGLQPLLEVSKSNRRSLYNRTLFDTMFFPVLTKSGARGRGVRKEGVRKGSENSVKSTVFRVRLFLSDQACRSRGLSRFWPDRHNGVQGVLEDTLDRWSAP